MNILYLLTADLNVGGAQKDILAFAKAYVQRKHKVVVVCRPGNLSRDLVNSGAKHYAMDLYFKSPFSFYSAVRNLKDIIIQENIDIIAPQSIRGSIIAYFINATRKPVLTTVHNVGSWFYSLISGMILNLTSNFIIFESEYERQRLTNLGLNINKTIVVHSGIDLSKFSPRNKDQGILRSFQADEGEVIIGTVARLSPEKGQEYLIEAMGKVTKDFPRAKLIFIGDGPLKDELVKKVEFLGLKGSIKFLGEQSDIAGYLSLIDLFVLSSTRESFPLSAREAMAMGKPVVATKVGGCPEVVSDGKTGILVPPADAEALAAALIRLLNNKTTMQAMGENGRLRADNLFNQNNWLNTNEEIMSYLYTNNAIMVPKGFLRNLFSTVLYLVKTSKQQSGIRILTYHRVTDGRPFDRLCVKTGEFRKQMEFLKRNGYEVIKLDAVYSQLLTADNQNFKQYKSKVVITLDDGFSDNYTNAYQILNEYGFPATIFLTVNHIGKDKDFLNWEQIKEMSRNNISFGAHTLNHPELTKISLQKAEEEINCSKEIIESNNLECDFFCYPKGDANQDIKDMVRKAGFKVACGIKPGENFSAQDLFELKRTEISGFDSLLDFKKKLAGAYDILHRITQGYKLPRPLTEKQSLTDNKRINVLYVIWSLGLGGAEQVVINLAKGLDKEKFNPIVCCLNEEGVFAEELRKNGVRVLVLHKKCRLDLSIIAKIIDIIKKNQVKIVHTHLWGGNLWGRIASKFAHVPVVISTEHSVDVWKTRWHYLLDKCLSYWTDTIITVSASVREFYIQKANLKPEKLKVIYNGIDSKQYETASGKRKEFNFKNGQVILGIIGRLVPEKGHRYFLLALKDLLIDFNVKGFVVGSGVLEAELKQFSSDLGLDGEVIFTGFREDIPNLLKTIDILVMPSLREGLPIIALEAMASGVPIVATKVGGNPEVIIDGQTGILIEPKNSVRLKDAIAYLIHHKEFSQKLIYNSKKKVEEQFSLGNMLKQTQSLYEGLYNSKVKINEK